MNIKIFPTLSLNIKFIENTSCLNAGLTHVLKLVNIFCLKLKLNIYVKTKENLSFLPFSNPKKSKECSLYGMFVSCNQKKISNFPHLVKIRNICLTVVAKFWK